MLFGGGEEQVALAELDASEELEAQEKQGHPMPSQLERMQWGAWCERTALYELSCIPARK